MFVPLAANHSVVINCVERYRASPQFASPCAAWQQALTFSRVFRASQKIIPASQRHFGECRLFSWPRFARGHTASVHFFESRQRFGFQLEPGPQVSFLEAWKADGTSAGP